MIHLLVLYQFITLVNQLFFLEIVAQYNEVLDAN